MSISVLHRMRGKPEVIILLDFVTFVSAPCASSQGTVKTQNCLINKTKHLFRVLHRWQESFNVLFNTVGARKQSKQPNNSNPAESSVRSATYTKKKQDQDMKEGDVGLNTQEGEQEPVDAGQTHEGN